MRRLQPLPERPHAHGALLTPPLVVKIKQLVPPAARAG
jgi:hypothetical protein